MKNSLPSVILRQRLQILKGKSKSKVAYLVFSLSSIHQIYSVLLNYILKYKKQLQRVVIFHIIVIKINHGDIHEQKIY